MSRYLAPLLLSAAATLAASPAAASPADEADLRRQLAEMREQMARMTQRIDSLENELAAARQPAQAPPATAPVVASIGAVPPAVPAPAKPRTEVSWNGAPQWSDGTGWSFKPRGRLQVDAGVIDGPAKLAGGENLGFSAELRRFFLGFDGTMPGGFGYRVEADLANSDVQLTDVYLTYAPSKALTITLGQHKPFWGLDELTSDLNTSMMERAAYTNAFGFERRVGLSATYVHGALLAEGGVFTDDAIALNNDLDKSWSVDGRLVAMPKLAGGTLHLGGSVHWRDLNGSAANFRYRVRPFLHTTDLRFVDTGTLPATGERGLGAEAAWIGRRFHVVGESFWQTVRRPGFADPTFNGGYAEVGYLLTRDQTAYRNSVFEQIRPRAPLGSGGLGAVQVNVRYDWLSLSDAGIRGGRQHSAGIAVIWMPTMLVRFIATYGHLWTKDASVAAGFDRDYGADAAGMRAQFNF